MSKNKKNKNWKKPKPAQDNQNNNKEIRSVADLQKLAGDIKQDINRAAAEAYSEPMAEDGTESSGQPLPDDSLPATDTPALKHIDRENKERTIAGKQQRLAEEISRIQEENESCYGSFHEPEYGTARSIHRLHAPEADPAQSASSLRAEDKSKGFKTYRPRRKMTRRGKCFLLLTGLVLLLIIALIWAGSAGSAAAPSPDNPDNGQADQSQPVHNDDGDQSAAVPEEHTPAVDDGRPVVALTFDDGPSSTITPLLVEALKERDVPATFFMLGANAAALPEVVRQVAEAGNQIGSHTYDHEGYLTKLDDKALAAQINDTVKVLRHITGEDPRFLRPPYGAMDKATAGKIGWPMMLWTVDPRDWDTRDAQKVYEAVMNNVTDGSVILMHDIYESTLDAAIMVVDELKARGWRFVTLDEYYEIFGITPQPGHLYRGTQEVVL